MSGIDEILEKGRKLNLQRSHVPPKPVNRPNKNSKVRFAEENPSRINKLQFPGSFKHPICHHEADFTLNRSLLISDDHVRVLSRPRKNYFTPHPRCVTKTIPNCTLRLHDLAKPKLMQVVETFDQRMPNLNISEIERFLNKIFQSGYQTPKEALFFIKKSTRDREMRIRCQNAELRKLNKNLMRKQSEVTVNYSDHLVKCLRPYIIGNQFISLTGDDAKYSESILRQICRLMKQNVPVRDSCGIVDQIFCRISDKIAYWMLTLIEKSGFDLKIDDHVTKASGCMEDSHPIEDFYNPEPEEAVGSESTADENDVENDNQVVDLQPDTSDLFLRRSQVVVDPNDCAALFSKITQYQNEKIRRDGGEQAVNTDSGSFDADKKKKQREKKKIGAKKGATGKDGKLMGVKKRGKKDLIKGRKDVIKGKKGDKKDGKKADKDRKDKKKGDKGKKSGREHSDSDEFDCYGDFEKMPQWNVQWVDHSSKF